MRLTEDQKRKFFILRTILRGWFILAVVAVVIHVVTKPINNDPYTNLITYVVISIIFGIYIFSRYFPPEIPSLILVSIGTLTAYFLAFRWGTGIPQSWTIIILTVVISGILISSRAAIVLAFFHSAVFLSLTYLQINGRLSYQWWDNKPTYGSIAVMLIISGIIALISWLSNREIERALKRARKSEKSLRKERDMLEVNVAEKTRQLQEVWEKERMNMQEFASIGRHTVGVIHDLVTPLTTLSLNLKMFKNINHSRLISKATQASEQIEQYIERTRKRIDNKDAQTYFSISKEINRAKKSVAGKTRSARVKITLPKTNLEAFGNPFSFYQLMLNLLDNAIDSYPPSPKDFGGTSKKREVNIDVKKNKQYIFLTVTDYGHGIALRDRKRIFDPFFTTKATAGKMGVGLSICKEIAEKDFEGTISVKSKLNQGTTFVIKLPIVKKI